MLLQQREPAQASFGGHQAVRRRPAQEATSQPQTVMPRPPRAVRRFGRSGRSAQCRWLSPGWLRRPTNAKPRQSCCAGSASGIEPANGGPPLRVSRSPAGAVAAFPKSGKIVW